MCGFSTFGGTLAACVPVSSVYFKINKNSKEAVSDLGGNLLHIQHPIESYTLSRPDAWQGKRLSMRRTAFLLRPAKAAELPSGCWGSC